MMQYISEIFSSQKHCIEEQKRPLNERKLWYYAHEKKVENICYQGIDFKHGLNNGPVGTGKYFFTSPGDAHKARAKKVGDDDILYLFLCEVNVGKMVKVYSF